METIQTGTSEQRIHLLFDTIDNFVHTQVSQLQGEDREVLLNLLAEHYTTLAGDDDQPDNNAAQPESFDVMANDIRNVFTDLIKLEESKYDECSPLGYVMAHGLLRMRLERTLYLLSLAFTKGTQPPVEKAASTPPKDISIKQITPHSYNVYLGKSCWFAIGKWNMRPLAEALLQEAN